MALLDRIDREILRILQLNSAISTKQLAAELKLTNTPVYERVKRLEKNGIIQRYRAELDPVKVGKELTVFIHVSLKEHTRVTLTNFEREINLLDEVAECYHVSGEHDYLLKALFKNMLNYRDFLTNKLAKISNISNVHSSFVVSAIKTDNIIHLD
jgi:Lrp/AsnC family leucine-responsive transcriptional regulator